jgi:N-acyl amino acid synthase of PEP-CTERM/exosortase system
VGDKVSFESQSVPTDIAGGSPDQEPGGKSLSASTTGPLNLADHYRQYFEVRPANTLEQQRQAHQLRYAVYCLENHFEPQNREELEVDEFDARSVHSLLVHRPTGDTAGTVRLVLPHQYTPRASLPIHRICTHPWLADPTRTPPAQSAEISRFAISKSFRRRREDARYPGIRSAKSKGRPTEAERSVIPYMALGLMNAIVAMSVDQNITHWCAVMEPALLRLLARLGIHFSPLGPLVEHHGQRQPVWAEADQLLAGIWKERPDVWAVITEAGNLWPLPNQKKQ